MNDSNLFSVLVTRGASIVTGTGIAPFIGDVGIGARRAVRGEIDGDREFVQVLRVDDLGDLRVFTALETIDAVGMCRRARVGPGARARHRDHRARLEHGEGPDAARGGRPRQPGAPAPAWRGPLPGRAGDRGREGHRAALNTTIFVSVISSIA